MAGILGAGAQDLKRSDPNEGQAEIYALQIADTVIVQPGGAAPEVVTSTATKSWADVAYYFKVSSLCLFRNIAVPCSCRLVPSASCREHWQGFQC